MAEKKYMPAIRFKGFSEEWEVHELLSGATKIGDGLHGTPQYVDNGGVFFINGNNLFSGKINITNETKQVSKNEQSKDDKELDTNTILISINGTIGNLAYYQGEEVMLGKSVAFISLEKFNKAYIYSYLQTRRVISHFNNNLTGSTIKNLGLKAIRETNVFIPKYKTEQTKIGSYFHNLNKLISLHQAKVNKLVSLKKAMLEKMFPKNGADVPEIRFKGFEGAWEEKELNEFCTYHTSSLSIGDAISNGKYELYDANSVIGYTNTNMQSCDYITIIKDGSGVGRVRLLPKNTSFIGTMGAFHPKSSDINFLLCALIKTDFSKHITGATIPHVYFSSYGKEKYRVPHLDEQQKIGTYFQNLDQLITLNQSELDKLNNLKKACLEQMFV